MMREMLEKLDVAEVYSPPRVVEVARRMGPRAGWSPDLTTTDEEGNVWDLNQLKMRNKAVRLLLQDEPTLLIGSPICTPFTEQGALDIPVGSLGGLLMGITSIFTVSLLLAH